MMLSKTVKQFLLLSIYQWRIRARIRRGREFRTPIPLEISLLVSDLAFRQVRREARTLVYYLLGRENVWYLY